MASHLHQRLRIAREQAGHSQAAIAACCGVKRGAVTLWESSNDKKRTVPGLSHLKTVADLTGVPLWWLVDDAAVIPETWGALASNDPSCPSELPAWAGLSHRHLRLAQSLDRAAQAGTFPAEVAEGMAEMMDGIIKSLRPAGKRP